MAAIVICFAVVLAGCGKKDSAAVVKDLDRVMNKLDSYRGAGTMVLHTGLEPQEYAVEVCYQAPHYYRISLTNEKKDITQIVLRNDDGVFVLTPHLNKSFRFQSDWPENQGQVYLYQSLAQSILMDNERQFTVDKEAYVFDVQANYQNGSLARQKIWLSKKDLAPQHVEVSDANSNVMVVVDFKEFEFGKKFDKDSFDMQRNMTSYNLKSLPAMTEAGNNAATAAGSDKAAAPVAKQQFGVIEPAYTPAGVKRQDIRDVKLGDEKAVLIRYSGTYNYTLIESMPETQTVTSLPGDIVDLGYTLAVVTGEDKKTLTWTYDGVEFRLSTGDLPLNEMIKVAQAVQGQTGK
jgi:outer membrane lipoprotein-sorting protein